MSVNVAVAELSKAAKDLARNWSVTRNTWRDEMVRNFEKKHLEPIEKEIKNAVAAMTQISEVIQRAKRDCQ